MFRKRKFKTKENIKRLANTEFLSDISIGQMRFDMYGRINVCLVLCQLLIRSQGAIL